MYKIKMLQVDRMVKEAETFAKGRQGKVGCHSRKNQADSVLYQTRSNKKRWAIMFLVRQGESRG